MEHGAMNNEEQGNDHIEEDSTNTLIHDTFNVRLDDYYRENDDFYDVHDLPLLEKAYKPLYEGSNTNLLSAYIPLILNLKVMNGLSNISVTWMLRYIKYSNTYI